MEANPLDGTDWGEWLADEFRKRYWTRLVDFLRNERSRGPVYPPSEVVFRAFELTPCNATRVVILGQDPYPRDGEAHGLCFSVPVGVDPPRSLASIHRELERDKGFPRPPHGSLEPWACRGVLLVNTTLTVGPKAGSHFGQGWEQFTDAAIKVVTAQSHPVFLLWGERAQAKEGLILRSGGDPKRILKSSHPAPPACYRPCGESAPFVHSRPFSRANAALGEDPIDWDLGCLKSP